MAEKMLRPDTAQVKRWMTEAARIDEQLRLAADSEAQQRTDARKAAQALFDDRVRKALEEMDVEHINRGKQGLRIGPLRDAGIENVWQLSQYTYGKLCALDGVGDQSARKIQDTVKQIAENTKDTIRVRIRVEELQPVDTALIRSLYVLVRCRPIRETCKMLYQENHVPLKEELELAKQSLKGLGWLFSSRSKKERLLQGVEGLRVRLTEKLESGSILEIWEQTANPSEEVCVADYCQNAPEYYAELEKLGLERFHENMMRLLDHWFEDGSADDVTELISQFIFSSGSWGGLENHVLAMEARNLNRTKPGQLRRNAIFRTIFPRAGQLKYRYPILQRRPYLLPAVWVWRWIDTLLFSREKIGRQKRRLDMIRKGSVTAYQRSLDLVGLGEETKLSGEARFPG